MKLPKGFRPDKSLEKKTEQLIKKAKKKKIDPKKSYLEKLTSKAMQVAINLGEGGPPIEDYHCHFRCIYTDLKKELVIDYRAIIDPSVDELAFFALVVSYKDEHVFVQNEKGIQNYEVGKWEEQIENLYDKIISEE